MDSLNHILLGGISVTSLIAGLFFLRFWKTTRDRFFLYFAASFLIEGVNRFFLGLLTDRHEDAPLHYLIRAISYGLILFAILDKNMSRDSKK